MSLLNTINGKLRYDSIFSDPRLINHKYFEEDMDTILLWQTIGKEYGVSDDPKFFIYAMKEYLKGYNYFYGMTFLYAESSILRNDQELNNYLTALLNFPIDEYTTERCLTYEEKLDEYNNLDLCPFNDEPDKAVELCKKHFNCCEVCRKCELQKDSMYLPFVKQMKLKESRNNNN